MSVLIAMARVNRVADAAGDPEDQIGGELCSRKKCRSKSGAAEEQLILAIGR